MTRLILLARRLLIDRTDDSRVQFFRTSVIGVISLVIDVWIMALLIESGVHYLASAAAGFGVSVGVNWALNRRFVFSSSRLPLGAEIAGYLAIALIGLGATELILYALIELAGLHYLASKACAAVIVLMWTFFARKYLLYSKK